MHRVEVDVVVGVLAAESNDRLGRGILALAELEVVDSPLILETGQYAKPAGGGRTQIDRANFL